jgi:hypothetical protein
LSGISAALATAEAVILKVISSITQTVNSTTNFSIFPTKLNAVKFLEPNILFLI